MLDALSIGVSLLRGNFSTASSVMSLLDLGSLLEEWTRKKSVADLARSMSLHVDTVWLKRDGTDITVSADDLNTLLLLKRIADTLAKRTVANYRFVLGFNTGLILLWALGILQPAASALLHNASTIAVSLKSMTDLLE